MEVTPEVEDDGFFADISRQISLLITEDDENTVTQCPSVSPQALTFSQSIRPSHVQYSSTLLYEHSYRGESKGTGVFIPRSSPLRKKSRQGRIGPTASSNTKNQKQPDNSRPLSHLPYSSSLGRF